MVSTWSKSFVKSSKIYKKQQQTFHNLSMAFSEIGHQSSDPKGGHHYTINRLKMLEFAKKSGKLVTGKTYNAWQRLASDLFNKLILINSILHDHFNMKNPVFTM